LTIFGATAVSMMVLTYALEERHRAFIALFAVACALSSVLRVHDWQSSIHCR
jgi:hypothetical protein